ncbi:DNA-binding NtrC family response regulator [Pedobacter cryoconitis]|uniref:DNA-binding NtrC family response regulator n=1 Tax=Pedobacter cryoconitis TaxID=188932 RepID=A0A7W8ZJC6_9SPHI|nr:response regulator [Pedobacter cryoconitis]MBB5634967.1 DNA-binding NtrC family response regulator [Pedobacter cryoconitis]
MNAAFDKKIFIVDDDPFLTAMLEQILMEIGFTNLDLFADGKSCIQNIHQKPEIIFLDYQMEEMNGLDVLKKIKENSPETAVIFTTALEDLSIAMQSITHGSCDFLLKKNISRKEVESILSEILN